MCNADIVFDRRSSSGDWSPKAETGSEGARKFRWVGKWVEFPRMVAGLDLNQQPLGYELLNAVFT
jgi:hypothetical protein